MRPSPSCSAASRPGSSAGRSATSCSAVPSSTSTSPARARSARRGATRAASAGRRSRSRSATAPGGSRSRTGARSTSSSCRAARSRPTSPDATSRSTRSRCPSPAASRSIPQAAAATSSGSCCGPSPGTSSTTTRCGSCAPSGSRTSSASGWTRARRPSCAQARRGRAEPAGERVLGELRRLSPAGWLRLDELGLLEALGGSAARLREPDLLDSPDFLLVAAFGAGLERWPISNELRRYAHALLRGRGARGTARRARSTASGAGPSRGRSRRSPTCTRPGSPRRCARPGGAEPAEPLLRGDELGLSPGPEIGRMLEEIAEERAAGTVSTREEAQELVRRSAEALRRDR